jgi:hypothetical protein
VVGNLFHHGVETMLKSVLLLRGRTPMDLKDTFGHNLPRLWAEVRAGVALDWSGFDGSIDELNRWEEIRALVLYPWASRCSTKPGLAHR